MAISKSPHQTRIGVVIPVRNRPTFVCNALDTVARQTLPPDRLLVVDDGSDDNTTGTIRRWLEYNPLEGAELLFETHKGAAASRNIGLSRCSDCDFIAFLDSDDLWPPDFLERTVEKIRCATDAVAVSVDRQTWDVGLNTRETEVLSALAVDPLAWIYQFGAGVASCTLLRTEAVHQAGVFPEEHPTGHDILLFGRVATLGRWLHSPGQPVIFRRNYASTVDEMPHVGYTYPDSARRWARIYEELSAQLATDHKTPPNLKKQMARRWRRAGRQAEGNMNFREASACYRRSLVYQPTAFETWLALFKSMPKSLA